MATASAKSKSGHYEKARESFDNLAIEQRARFLVEAAFSTVAEGIEKMTTVLSSEFDSAFCTEEEGEKRTSSKAKSKSKSASKSTRAKSARSSTSRKSSNDNDETES